MTKELDKAWIKDVLVQKFRDEGCCYKRKDISIRKLRCIEEEQEYRFRITISGYEHCPFTVDAGHDNNFGYVVFCMSEGDEVAWTNSKNGYEWEGALKQIGYYIATRF